MGSLSSVEQIDYVRGIADPVEFGVLAVDEDSVWSSTTAWILLLPLVYFLTGGFMLSINDPDAFLVGGVGLLSAGELPYSRQLQELAWLITCCLMLPYRAQIANLLKQFKVLSVLMVLVFASGFWADNTIESLRRGLLLNLTILLGLYLSVRFTPKQQLSLLYGVGVFSVISSYFVAAFLPAYNRGFAGEWKGIFGHKNDLGVYLLFVLTPALFLKRGTRSTTVYRILVVLLGLGLIALSESRGAWVDGSVVLVYYIAITLLGRFERRNALVIMAVGLPMLGLLASLLYSNLGTIAYALGKDPNLSNRTLIWAAVWPSLLKRVVWGYGYGGFWNGLNGESGNVILAVGTGLAHAHNGILNLWLEIGLVGIVLALWITGRGVLDLFSLFGSRVSRDYVWYGAVLLVTVVGNIDESFFLRQNQLPSALWVLACVELHRSQIEVRQS